MAFGISAFSFYLCSQCWDCWDIVISDQEEDISPECARKRFLTGLRDGLPECRDASVFMVSFIIGPIVDLI